MELNQVLGYFGALAIGIVLGLIGSGGSLMAIPIFTYLFQISPITTTAYSLFVVGTAATVGALRNYRKRLVDLKIVLFFGVPAFIAVYLVRKFLIPVIPEMLFKIGGYIVTKHVAILFLLATLMLAAAYPMVKKNRVPICDRESSNYNYPFMVFAGGIIGVLTGIVGIGGGFLIIPSLVLCLRLPMKNAVATSLLIIALKSLIGFTGDIASLEISWTFLLCFTLISVLGILLGSYLSSFVKGKRLKKSFGWFLLLMALGIFIKELFL